MKVEIWRKSDVDSTSSSNASVVRTRIYRCYPATLLEYFEGKLTVELDGFSSKEVDQKLKKEEENVEEGAVEKIIEEDSRKKYIRVGPGFARRALVNEESHVLPNFIKLGAIVEVMTWDGDEENPPGYYLAKVVSIVGKEELVVEYILDNSKEIVLKSKCRLPNNNFNFTHYKEVDKLKKYLVQKGNPHYYEKKPAVGADVPSVEENSSDEIVQDTPEDKPDISPIEEEEEELIRLNENEETLVSSSVAHPKPQPPIVPIKDDKIKSLENLILTFRMKMESMSRDYVQLERAMSELSSDFKPLPTNRCAYCFNGNNEEHRRRCSAALTSTGESPPNNNLNNNGISSSAFTRWSSRNSVDDQDPSQCSVFSGDGGERPMSIQGVTPPPGLGPPSSMNNGGFFAGGFHQHHPAFLNGGPGSHPNMYPPSPFIYGPAARRQLGNKIFSVISQKLSEEEATKMTDAVLSSLM